MNYYCIGGDKVLGKQFRQLITNDHLRIRMTELAHVTGVSTSQIRYWERKGYISSKQSDKNKNHYFSFLTLFRVATIKYFLDQGFTLATGEKGTGASGAGEDFSNFYCRPGQGDYAAGTEEGGSCSGDLGK